MASSRGLHWKAPAIMIVAWLTGILLVYGHHAFNSRLNHEDAPTTSIEVHELLHFTFSQQKVNTSIATALAFLVKTCLGLAASVAYTQIIWYTAKRNKTRLGTIDSAFNATKDISAMFDFHLWRSFPLLTLLALLLFLISVPSIFTPASLSIVSAPRSPWHMTTVPFVDFTSLNFASIMNNAGIERTFTYRGPQYPVQEAVTASCADGSILPIEPVALNASWSLEFAGPAIDCNEVPPTEKEDILDNIREYMAADNCLTSFGYISWTPDDSGFVPFYNDSSNSTYTLRSSTLSTAAPGQLRTCIATFPKMTDMISWGGCDSTTMQEMLGNATVTSCGLYNTTYQTAFSYLDGHQNVSFTSAGNHNEIYAAPILTGALLEFNKTTIQNYAYQAVWDAFSRILVGLIYSSRIADNGGAIITVNTTIMDSALSNTKDLAFLSGWGSQYSSSGVYSLQNDILHGSEDSPLVDFAGTWVLQAPAYDSPLASTLERSFQNATISLMSSNLLQ
ncbi:hypothetical protein KCU95_g1468, partial [Aureobasidium melanogenum]